MKNTKYKNLDIEDCEVTAYIRVILPNKSLLKKRYLGLTKDGSLIFFQSQVNKEGIYAAKK